MYLCADSKLRTYIHTYVQIQSYVRTYIRMCRFKAMYVHTYVQIQSYVHTYICADSKLRTYFVGWLLQSLVCVHEEALQRENLYNDCLFI